MNCWPTWAARLKPPVFLKSTPNWPIWHYVPQEPGVAAQPPPPEQAYLSKKHPEGMPETAFPTSVCRWLRGFDLSRLRARNQIIQTPLLSRSVNRGALIWIDVQDIKQLRQCLRRGITEEPNDRDIDKLSSPMPFQFFKNDDAF